MLYIQFSPKTLSFDQVKRNLQGNWDVKLIMEIFKFLLQIRPQVLRLRHVW